MDKDDVLYMYYCSFLCDEILKGAIFLLVTLQNANRAAWKIQTGDMGTPSNRASLGPGPLVYVLCKYSLLIPL